MLHIYIYSLFILHGSIIGIYASKNSSIHLAFSDNTVRICFKKRIGVASFFKQIKLFLKLSNNIYGYFALGTLF